MHLYLGGHLSWYDSQKRSRIDVHLIVPTSLTQVLNDLRVPIAEIAVGTINGKALFKFDDVIVRDNDQIELYPPVGGG